MSQKERLIGWKGRLSLKWWQLRFKIKPLGWLCWRIYDLRYKTISHNGNLYRFDRLKRTEEAIGYLR